MMRKTCGGFVLSLAGFCLLGSSLFSGSAGSALAETALKTDTQEVLSASPIREQITQRLEAFQSADLAKLKAARDTCYETAQVMAKQLPELRRQVRDFSEEVRQNAPEIEEMRKQIQAMQANLEQAIREMPEIQEKLVEIAETEREMLVELQLRTALNGLIARKSQVAEPAANLE